MSLYRRNKKRNQRLSKMFVDVPGNEAPSYPPCLNPQCKSYGKSHPNCNCWGGKEGLFAEGGDVQFCAEGNEHEDGCEYKADMVDKALNRRKK